MEKSAKYVGLIPRFSRIFLGDKNLIKRYINILKVVNNKICPTCKGQRLNSKILSSKIMSKIFLISQMTIKENLEFQ